MKTTRKYGLWERVLAVLIALAMVLIPVEFHHHAHAEEPQQDDTCYSYTTDWTTYGYNGTALRSYAASSKGRNKVVVADGVLTNNGTDTMFSVLSMVKDGQDIAKTFTVKKISVDITMPATCSGATQYGLVYGVNGTSFNVAYLSNVSTCGSYPNVTGALDGTEIGTLTGVGGGTCQNSVTWTAGDTLNFAVEIFADHIVLYVDNVQVRNITTTTSATGAVGLYGKTGGNGLTFDNFKVELTDGTVYTEDFSEGSGDTYLDAATTYSGGAAPYEGRIYSVKHAPKWETDVNGHKKVCANDGCTYVYEGYDTAKPHDTFVDGECPTCGFECTAHNFPSTDPDKCSICGTAAVCFEHSDSWVINAYASSTGGIRAYSSGNVTDKYMVSGGVLSIANNDNTELIPTITQNGQAITDWSNYTVSVDFNHNYRGGNTMSGIVVGKTGGTYYIVTTCYNNIRIYAVTDDPATVANEGMVNFGTSTTPVQPQTPSGVSIATGTYYTLNVKVEGNTISAWVNDSANVATYTLTSGSIASAAPALFTRTVYTATDGGIEFKNFKTTVGGKTYNVAFDDADGSLSAATYDGATVQEGHSWPASWSAEDATQHSKTCQNGCGAKKTAAHTNLKVPTCTSGYVCDDCGSFGAADPDAHTAEAEWVDQGDGTCAKIYPCCSAVHTAAQSHVWGGDTVCDNCSAGCSHDWSNKDGVCADCGASCPGHSGGTATCIALAECETCGMAYGEYTACTYGDYTADETTHTRVCSVCSVPEIKEHTFSNGTCTVCAYACGHDFTGSDTCTLCGIDVVCYTYLQQWGTVSTTSAGVIRADQSGNAFITDGKLKVESNGRWHYGLLNISKGGANLSNAWTDYTVEVDITFNASMGGNDQAGIILRHDGQNYYVITVGSGGYVAVYRGTLNGSDSGMNALTSLGSFSTGGTAKGTTQTLKVTVSGNAITITLDGRPWRVEKDANDNWVNTMTVDNTNAVAAGTVGYFVKGGLLTYFDNFKVTVGQQVYEETFDVAYGDLSAYAGQTIPVAHTPEWEITAQQHHKICGNDGCGHEFVALADHDWVNGECSVCEYECQHDFTADPDECAYCGSVGICSSYDQLWILNQYASNGGRATATYTNTNPLRNFQNTNKIENGKLWFNTGYSWFEGNLSVIKNGVDLAAEWTDYTVEADITFPDMGGQHLVGLVLRDSGNARYIVVVGESGNVQLRKQVDADPTDNVDTIYYNGTHNNYTALASGSTGIVAENGTHTLKVTVVGGTFTAWLDGEPVLWGDNDTAEYTDATPVAKGSAGFFTYTSGLDVYIDNFKVTLAGGAVYDETFSTDYENLILDENASDSNGSVWGGYAGVTVNKTHNWAATGTYKDENCHTVQCQNEGCTAVKDMPHDMSDATCTDKATCSGCGYETGEKDPSNHAGEPEWVCTATTHQKKYDCCGAPADAVGDHDWADGKCSVCEYECQHDFTADPDECAYCDEKGICHSYHTSIFVKAFTGAGKMRDNAADRVVGKYTVAGGKLTLTGSDLCELPLSILDGNGGNISDALENYTVSVEFTKYHNNGNTMVGIMVGGGNVRYLVDVYFDTIRIYKMVDDPTTDHRDDLGNGSDNNAAFGTSVTPVYSEKLTNVAIELGVAYTLTVKIEGNKISAQINESNVVQYTAEAAIAAGAPALFAKAYYAAETQGLVFDNFKVVTADGMEYVETFSTDGGIESADYPGTTVNMPHNWAATGTYKDENCHSVECQNEGCTAVKDVPHDMSDATCTDKATCSGCGYETGEKDPSNHAGGPEWVCTATTHQKKYNCCGAPVGEVGDHDWDDGACSVCGYECQHDFAADPDKCSICGAAGICKTYTKYWLVNQFTSQGKVVTAGSGFFVKPSHSVSGGKFISKLDASMLGAELIVTDELGAVISNGWTDYTVSMDVDLPDDKSMNGARWVALFGRVSETEAYALHMNYNGYTLYRYTTDVADMEGVAAAESVLFGNNGNNCNYRVALASKTVAGGLCIDKDGGGTALGQFNVKMTFSGNNIKVYHNGQLIIDYTDADPIAAGHAAFTMNTGASEVTVDNFTVALHNGPTFTEDFAVDYESLFLDENHPEYDGYAPVTVHTPHTKVYESDKNGHQQVCAVCGVKFGAKQEHRWDDGACKDCGFECAHDFEADPDKCSICGDDAVCRHFTQLWILNQYSSAAGNASSVYNNVNDPKRNFQNSHEVAGGKLHVNAGYTWFDGTLSVLKNGVETTADWTDYTVQVDITFPDMTGAHAVGLVLRDSGDARYIVVVGESGNVQLRKQIDPDPTDRVDTIFYNGAHRDFTNLASATTGITAENGTHTLKVTVKGGTFTAWLDGVEVLWGPDKTAQFTDTDPVESGAVGFFVLGSGLDFYFDNFSVDLAKGNTYTDDFSDARDNLIADIGHGAYNGYAGVEYILGHAWPENWTAISRSEHAKKCQHYGCGAMITEKHSNVTPPTCSSLYGCDGCAGFGTLDPDNHEKEAAYVDNGDGTHKYYYPCCGKVLAASEKHTPDANGVCTKCKSGCEHDWSDHDGVCNKCGYECPEHFGGQANCMSPALCERCSTPYGVKGDHVWGKYVSEDGKHWKPCTIEGCTAISDEGECKGGTATCQKQAVCSTCKLAYGELAEHDWSTAYSSDGTAHWHECKFAGCDARKDVQEHSGGAAVNCVTPAVCEVCGTSYGAPLAGVHVGEIGWKHNALEHYKAYLCCGQVVGDQGRHSWDNGVCTVCGFACVHTSATANCQENICPICGQPNGEMNPDNHPGTTMWVNIGTQHKKVYTCCGKEVSPPEDHIYDANGKCTVCDIDELWEEPCDHVYDNDCDDTCNECGDVREVLDHIYDNACDPDCNVCGATREVPEHVYESPCDPDCDVCGDIREVPDHVYDNSCDMTCNVCGGYRFTRHTYDNECDDTCNVCGETRDPDDHVYDDEYDPDCNECGAIREVPERPAEPGLPWYVIVIIAVAAVAVVGGAVFLLLILKKKKKAQEVPAADEGAQQNN